MTPDQIKKEADAILAKLSVYPGFGEERWDEYRRLVVDCWPYIRNAALEDAIEVYRHSGTSEEVESRIRALKIVSDWK